MGLHDVFRVRSPVINSLKTIVPHKQRLGGGGVGEGTVSGLEEQQGSWFSATGDLHTSPGRGLPR